MVCLGHIYLCDVMRYDASIFCYNYCYMFNVYCYIAHICLMWLIFSYVIMIMMNKSLKKNVHT